MNTKLPHIIAIVGATASGKSALALHLAKEFDGELVSADSRQIYKAMDIGSAKDAGTWVNGRFVLEQGAVEHLVDVIDPNNTMTAAQYQQQAFKAIDDILDRGKLPIVVGGTGLYIQAIIDNLAFPKIEPDERLRASLKQKSLDELQKTYQELDPDGYASIDVKNPRRLLRAIEVSIVSGKPASKFEASRSPKYATLQIGVGRDRVELYDRIDTRVDRMIENGLIEEVKSLITKGVHTDSVAMTGIGYRQVVQFLQGEIDQNEMTRLIKRDTRHFAKRQLTWFKRDARIHWIEDPEEAIRLSRSHLKQPR